MALAEKHRMHWPPPVRRLVRSASVIHATQVTPRVSRHHGRWRRFLHLRVTLHAPKVRAGYGLCRTSATSNCAQLQKKNSTNHCCPVLWRCLRSRDEERHHHIATHPVACLRLVVAPRMVDLLIAMQPLARAAGVALESHAAGKDGVERVLVSLVIVPAVSRLGEEMGCELLDERMHQPVFADCRRA